MEYSLGQISTEIIETYSDPEKSSKVLGSSESRILELLSATIQTLAGRLEGHHYYLSQSKELTAVQQAIHYEKYRKYGQVSGRIHKLYMDTCYEDISKYPETVSEFRRILSRLVDKIPA